MFDRILSVLNRTPAHVLSAAANSQVPPSNEPAGPPPKRHPGISLYGEGPVRKLCVKKYGAGKSYAWMSGPAEYAEVAGECLLRSFTTVSYIMEEFFRERMRQRGVPEHVINGFLSGARVDDEAFLSECD